MSGYAIGFVGAALLLGGILFPDQWQTRLVAWALTSLRQWGCAELLRAGRLPWRAAIIGVAAPGPAGMVRAPLSGASCVWFRTRIWVHGTDPDGHDEEQVAWVHEPVGSIAVDDRTGTVLLAARLLESPLIGKEAPKVVTYQRLATRRADEHVAALRDLGLLDRNAARRLTGRGAWVDEAVVPAGRRLLAVGAPSRRGTGRGARVKLGRSALGLHVPIRFGVSTMDLAALRAHAGHGVEHDETWVPFAVSMMGVLLMICGIAVASNGFAASI